MTSLIFPSSLKGIGKSAFLNCEGLSRVTLPEGITSIGETAFASCERLSSTTIPSSVIKIGDRAFSNCLRLINLTISQGVTSIGEGAFRSCGNLPRVIIPSSVSTIGKGAFERCSRLTSLTISEGIANIGREAFRDCSILTRVMLPSSVTSIGYAAFGHCSELRDVFFLGDTPVLESNVFDSAAPEFSIYYLAENSGFASPTWEGYPAVEIDQSVYPATIWLLTHGLSYDSDLHQDFNGDGVTLLTAYALNLDPSSALGGMPQPMIGPSAMSMTFYANAPGVTYGAEASTDLQAWETEGVTISDLDPANMRTVTGSWDSTIGFLRLTFDMSP